MKKINQQPLVAHTIKKRFFISTIATIPILILSPMIQRLFAFSIDIPYQIPILATLATFIYGYGGWLFIKGCFYELTEKKAGMMTLVAVAITSAHIYSIFVAFTLIEGTIFFLEVATLIDIMLFGHWLEMKAMVSSNKALQKLARLLPSTVSIVLPDGKIQTISLSKIKLNDKILIKPGEKIPADGIITEGRATINQAMLTGESKPVIKKEGDTVIGGSINQNGSLVVQVNKVGKESYLAKIITLVKQASSSKSKAQTIANKAAFSLTIIALFSGVTTLLWWLSYNQSIHFALERMISVMVITCPHALGLAVPLVIVGITSIAAHNGFLIKNRTAFENARKCTHVVFDKTGTLTTGKFGVTQIIPCSKWHEDKILQHAAAVEQRSEHNIAKSIVQQANEKNIKIPHIANFKAFPGLGAQGFVDGKIIFVGTSEVIATKNSSFSTNFPLKQASDVYELIQKLTAQGKTVIVVATPDEIKGLITLSDVVRKESLRACKQLKKMNFKIVMLTGDNQQVAQNVAEQLGISIFFANVFPEQKADIIKKLQEKKNQRIIMVGDGINDAPALAQADIGIAIGSGTDIAAETADVILVQNNPQDVVHVIKLSQLMNKKIIQNLLWATGYNIIAIPLAAGIFYTQGIIIPPAIGALIMSLSTIIVAFNSRLIKK